MPNTRKDTQNRHRSRRQATTSARERSRLTRISAQMDIPINYYPSATLYGVYGTFVIYGLIAWRKLVRAQYVRRSARPQRKSVEAHPGWVVGQE
jgi:hypothetical protein